MFVVDSGHTDSDRKHRRTGTQKFWVPPPLNPGLGSLWHKFGLWVLCIPPTPCLSVLFFLFYFLPHGRMSPLLGLQDHPPSTLGTAWVISSRFTTLNTATQSSLPTARPLCPWTASSGPRAKPARALSCVSLPKAGRSWPFGVKLAQCFILMDDKCFCLFSDHICYLSW